MPWLDEPEYRAKHVAGNSTEISPAAIEDALKNAEDEVCGLCGEEVRAYVAGAAQDSPKYRKLRKAQDLLATREMLLDSSFASRFRDGGIMESEKDLNDSAVNKYESFARETQARRKALREEAYEILSPYLLKNVEGDEYGAGFEYSHPAAAAAVTGDDCRLPN